MQQLKLVYRDPRGLNPYANNPRVNDLALPKLKADIEEFGFVSPVLVAGDEIVDGHARHKVALEMGLETIPTVDVSHLTPEQIRALRLVMNKSAEWAQWDEERLLDELRALQDMDIDMGAFGFDLSAFEPEMEIQDDNFDCTPPAEPKAERGALYRLGRHILMCGDSTESGDVSRLMAGELADLLLTDPPYNVDYEGATAERLKIDNDHMSEEDYRAFLCTAFGAADEVMRPGAAFYLWHADSNRHIVQNACEDTDWRVRQNLIWRKNHFAMGRQDYHWQHEPCLYGWKDGAAHYSAKELVNIIPTNGLTGSFNFEKGTPAGLVDFDDGDAIDASQEPEFEKKPFRIHFMGKMLYLSNILGQIEQAGLMAYINKWFVKNAIVTENKKIFKTIQVGTPKSVKGLDQLRQRVNRDLDPDAMIGARIVTNQTGFSIMDEEKDETGRPMLQPDPTVPTRMLFKGYPVEYFSDTLLPNISSGKAPLFFGSLDAASYFIDLLGYQFAVSEHFRFDQNQKTMRVIEGFDNLLADKDAYLYCAFEEKETEIPTP